MSIWAEVEVEGRHFLPLTENRTISKTIATFCLEPLFTYCDYQASKDQHGANEEEGFKEIIAWFSDLTARMQENICLVSQATYGFWDYAVDEYERYRQDHAHLASPDMLSKERFLQECQAIEQKWTDTKTLKRVIDDVIKVIDRLHPKQTWWYTEEETLTDLRLLSETLEIAVQMGYNQVRIYCS